MKRLDCSVAARSIVLPLLAIALSAMPTLAFPAACAAEETAPQAEAAVAQSGEWYSDSSNHGSWTLYEDGYLLIEGTGDFVGFDEIGAGNLARAESVEFGEGIKAIRNYFTDWCRLGSVSRVVLPSTLNEIGYRAFYGCTSLQSVELNEGLESIEEEAFSGCSSLAEIKLNSDLNKLGPRAFNGASIKTFVLPKHLETFDASAVSGCNNLESITFLGQCPDNFNSSYYYGNAYSGKTVKAYHRAKDKSWNVAGKYMLGDFTWYTLVDDGSATEDNYVSPYWQNDMDIVTDDAGYGTYYAFSGKSSGNSLALGVASRRTVAIHWDVILDSDCDKSSFKFTLKDITGNKGKVVKEWSVATGDTLSGEERIDLDSGSYVMEVVFSDTHNNSEGSACVFRRTDFSFGDVGSDLDHADDISWLATKGVTMGWNNGDGSYSFRPYKDVARADMAAFLYRLAGSPEYSAPASSPFADVTSETPHYTEICWLADQGISEGWTERDGSKTFRPYNNVARADMAAFLYRLAGSPTYTASNPSFDDVDTKTAHYKEICWLAEWGITRGWQEKDGSCTFRPFNSVARADMAAFLHRIYDYVLVRA